MIKCVIQYNNCLLWTVGLGNPYMFLHKKGIINHCWQKTFGVHTPPGTNSVYLVFWCRWDVFGNMCEYLLWHLQTLYILNDSQHDSDINRCLNKKQGVAVVMVCMCDFDTRLQIQYIIADFNHLQMISTKATTPLTAWGTVIQMLSKLWRIRSAYRWLDSLSQMQSGWMSSRNSQHFGGTLCPMTCPTPINANVQ